MILPFNLLCCHTAITAIAVLIVILLPLLFMGVTCCCCVHLTLHLHCSLYCHCCALLLPYCLPHCSLYCHCCALLLPYCLPYCCRHCSRKWQPPPTTTRCLWGARNWGSCPKSRHVALIACLPPAFVPLHSLLLPFVLQLGADHWIRMTQKYLSPSLYCFFATFLFLSPFPCISLLLHLLKLREIICDLRVLWAWVYKCEKEAFIHSHPLHPFLCSLFWN